MPMSEIGALRVRLAMNVGQFIKNSKRARRASGSMTKAIGKGLAGLAATSGASAAIIARASARVADSMDMLNKKARTAGVTAEFYQTMRFAAIEAGVAHGKLDKAMETFLKRVGEARLGLGPLASKLKQYDEELFEAIKTTRSQEQALRLLAEATRNETDAANRGALTSAAFSKANLQMIRIMEQGPEVFDRTTKKAREFNAIIGQDVLDNMSEVNNRMGVATEQISQNWSAMVAQMAKETVGFQERLADTMKTIREFWFSLREIQNLPLTDARRVLGETEQDIARIRGQLEKLRSGGAQGPAAQIGATEKMNNLQTQLNEKLQKQRELAARITGLSQRRLTFEQQINEQAGQAAGEDGEAGAFTTEKVETATLLNERLARGMRLMETAQTPLDQYREKIDAINAAQAHGLGNTQKWADAQRRAALMVASSYAGLAGDVAGSLGQIFGESKGVAIAQAVINTAQAVTRTLAQYGGTPWGWANAAAAAAAGAAEIATIKRTTKGSSGGSSGARAASGSAAGASSGQGGQGGVQQGVNITLQGRTFDRDQISGLIEQINEQVADGAQLNVSFA